MEFHLDVVASGGLLPAEEVEVLALHRRAFPSADPLSLENLRRSSASPHILVLARRASDKGVVGMGCFAPYYLDTDWSYVWNLGVDPPSQGLGIGRSLTEKKIELARQAGKTLLFLRAVPESEAYFRHLGFSEGDEELRARFPAYVESSEIVRPLFLRF